MCDISLEHCEVWQETPRVARKEHLCSSCGGTIKPGVRYLSHFSIFEGDTTFEKICEPCKEDRGEFADAHDGTIPTPGYFPELLNQCIADGDEESEKLWKPMLEALQARTAS